MCERGYSFKVNVGNSMRTPLYTLPGISSISSNSSIVVVDGILPRLLPKSALDSIYAPTANPIFTGTVTVPTPDAASNSTIAASTAWVRNSLVSSNITHSGQTLDTILGNTVRLGGVLGGTITAPTLSATGVTAGTYNFASITVGADGRISSASSNTVAGGSIPAASSNTAGVIKTSSTQSDPICYTVADSNGMFVRKATDDTILATHNFTSGLRLSGNGLSISNTAPSNGLWVKPDVRYAYYREGAAWYGLHENIVQWDGNAASNLTHIHKFSQSNAVTGDSLSFYTISWMFRYSGYNPSNLWSFVLSGVGYTGIQTVIHSGDLIPNANPWVLLDLVIANTVRDRFTGLILQINKTGTPGNLEYACSIPYRLLRFA